MKFKKIMIFINGLGGTGKDTFIEFCREEKEKNIMILNFSTIDPSKQAAKILGWENLKTEEDREFLIALKNLSKKYNNGPRKHIINELKKIEYLEKEKIIFVHTREKEEIKEFKKYFIESGLVDNTLSLLLERNGKNISNICKADEVFDLKNYEYDYKIITNSLQDSREKSNVFINYIIKKYF